MLHGEISGPLVTSPSRFSCWFEYGPSGYFLRPKIHTLKTNDFTPGGSFFIDADASRSEAGSRLAQYRTYHYRLVVRDSQTNETYYGEDQAFTTDGNTAPVAPNSVGVADPDTLGPISISPGVHDPDANNGAMITGFGQPENGGSVSIGGSGNSLIYTPFTGFTGSDRFTYTVSDGYGATASGEVEIVPLSTYRRLVAGTYEALLTTVEGSIPVGAIRLTVNPAGTLTGTLDYFGVQFTFADSLVYGRSSGEAPGGGYASYFLWTEFAVPRLGLPPFTIQFTLGLYNATPTLTGLFITNSSQIAFGPLAAFVQADSAVPEAGRYTAILPASTDGELPQGHGYASINVKENGAVRFAGRAGDGMPFSRGTRLRRDRSVSISAKVGGAQRDRLSGGGSFAASGGNDFTGSFTWYRPQSIVRAYREGFLYFLGATGDRYIAPEPGAAALPYSNLSFPTVKFDAFDHSNTSLISRIVPVSLGGSTSALFHTGDRIRFRVNRLSGVFRGTLITSQTRDTPRKLGGVVLQKKKLAAGVVGRSGRDGRVEFVAQ